MILALTGSTTRTHEPSGQGRFERAFRITDLNS
jgi:hypothetical protein